MNQVLEQWNQSPAQEAVTAVLSCCGSHAWATKLCESRPYRSPEEVMSSADEIWQSLDPEDWSEAFGCHPRIGESARGVHGQSAEWSQEEQSGAQAGSPEVLASIARLNKEYEERHGFTYIVCATGKSAEELLSLLEKRIANSTLDEIREAAEQQRQITQLRLKKWLQV